MTKRTSEIRHFLYLDDHLVTEFLAQLEEGELNELRYQTASESSGAASGRLGLPIARVEGDTAARAQESLQYLLRLSPPSRFQRLTRILDEFGELTVEPRDLRTIPAGSFAIVAADVTLTGLSRLALGFRDLERSTEFFGRGTGPSVTASWAPRKQWASIQNELSKRRQVKEWRRLRRMMVAMEGSNIPIIGHAADANGTKVLSRLRRAALHVDVPQLTGRARLLIKIVRVIGDEEVVDAAEVFPGAPQLTSAFRQGLEASPASHLVGDVSVRAPAVITTAVAIYR